MKDAFYEFIVPTSLENVIDHALVASLSPKTIYIAYLLIFQTCLFCFFFMYVINLTMHLAKRDTNERITTTLIIIYHYFFYIHVKIMKFTLR